STLAAHDNGRHHQPQADLCEGLPVSAGGTVGVGIACRGTADTEGRVSARCRHLVLRPFLLLRLLRDRALRGPQLPVLGFVVIRRLRAPRPEIATFARSSLPKKTKGREPFLGRLPAFHAPPSGRLGLNWAAAPPRAAASAGTSPARRCAPRRPAMPPS